MLSSMSIVAMPQFETQTGGMKTFGEFLAARRVAAGYRSQTEFATAIGKGSSWVSRLERGAAKELPPPEDVALLAKHLNVSQAELIAAAGYDVETGTEGDTEAVSAIRAILGNRDLTDEQVSHLVSIVQTLVHAMKG